MKFCFVVKAYLTIIGFMAFQYQLKLTVPKQVTMNMMDAIPLDGIEFNGYDYWNSKYPNFTYFDFCLMMQDP